MHLFDKIYSLHFMLNYKIMLKILVFTAVILLVPFLLGWQWAPGDYLIMGALIFVFGTLLAWTARSIRPGKYKFLMLFAIAAIFVYIWAELAVGLFFNIGS